ncbi:hypothetical protein A5686_06125 [Mycobacterium sp. E2479]|nr:hypothetical protein A5686_06125 [Mycobacterium sp. E2479]
MPPQKLAWPLAVVTAMGRSSIGCGVSFRFAPGRPVDSANVQLRFSVLERAVVGWAGRLAPKAKPISSEDKYG